MHAWASGIPSHPSTSTSVSHDSCHQLSIGATTAPEKQSGGEKKVAVRDGEEWGRGMWEEWVERIIPVIYRGSGV